MLSSIELDHDSSLKTCEIENVVAERMLPPKFCSVDLPAPQRLPQLVFGVGRVASQCALALIIAEFIPGLAFHASLLFFLCMLVRWGSPSPPSGSASCRERVCQLV